ncbi:hypothetical protein ACLBOM_26375 [Escherichia coli]
MEIRNECCLPSHSSPKMYLGTCFFDLSSSWGFDARDDLLRTIHRMIDNGHAARLAMFISPLVCRRHVNGVTHLLMK